MSTKVYEMVTERIIKKLEEGVVPWRLPWRDSAAVNWVTQKPYRGINTMLLPAGEYATFKQVTAAGGKVKKGEKSHMVVFWKWIEVEDVATNKKDNVPLVRYYNVFEINTQVEGLTSKRPPAEEREHDPVDAAEAIIKGYPHPPEIRHISGQGAFYNPKSDYIVMPKLSDFTNCHEYYSTMFHEMAHSTGHITRLNREGIGDLDVQFGSEKYSKEELVAEMGASMLCAIAQVDNDTIDNSAAYIQSWLRKLKDDKLLLVRAAGQAQKAADHILGISFEPDPKE